MTTAATAQYAPHFYAIAGPLGCGKGVDMARALCGAMFVEAGAPGQLGDTSLPAWQTSHIQIQVAHGIADDLGKLVPWCESAEGSELIKRAGALVVTDATLAIEDSVTDWRRSAESASNKYYAFNQRDLMVKALRAVGRHLGVLVVCLFHVEMPRRVDGIVVEEGRLAVGSNKPEASNDISASADCTWIYEDWPDGPDPWWSKRYRCDPADQSFRGKDRNDVLGVLNLCAPANFREYLRAVNGAVLPRPVGQEWQEDLAERVAAAMESPDLKIREIVKVAQGFANGRDPYHVRWAIQDGIARHGYRHLRGIFDLDDLPTRGASAAGAPPPPPAPSAKPPPPKAP